MASKGSIPGNPGKVAGSPGKNVPGAPSSVPGRNITPIGNVPVGKLSAGFMSESWEGVVVLQANAEKLGGKLVEVAKQVCQKLAVDMQAYAQANAPWEDRTGDARDGLTGTFIEMSETVFAAEIAHTVSYGTYLESGFGGRYQIILPTIVHFAALVGGLEQAQESESE